MQGDRLFKEDGTSIFGPFVNDIPIRLFEYEYRFTEYEYEYEKNQWYDLPATIMSDGSLFLAVVDDRRWQVPPQNGAGFNRAKILSEQTSKSPTCRQR
jgi:hypothetical protein